jgi:phospholipid/cholesterol/gamma-HCH transport system ATP-binding protein
VEILRVNNLHKQFNERSILSGVSFSVARGGVVSILGSSGTGKSVLLRCVVGLLSYEAGDVHYLGEPLSNEKVMQRLRRDSSYVFQHNALFDSITVQENILLPLRARGVGSPGDWNQRADAILRRMDLLDAAQRYPEELSGGMQKRLAGARSTATQRGV